MTDSLLNSPILLSIRPPPHLLRNCLLLDHPPPTAISVALRGGYGYFLEHHNSLCKSASTLLLIIFYVNITSIKFPNYSALILRITSHQLEYVEGNSANKSCKAMGTKMHLVSHMLHEAIFTNRHLQCTCTPATYH